MYTGGLKADSMRIKGEKFWRAHLRFKTLVRRIYRNVNVKPFDENYPEQTLAYLKSLFKPYNQQLAVELLKRGYKTCRFGWPGKLKLGARTL